MHIFFFFFFGGGGGGGKIRKGPYIFIVAPQELQNAYTEICVIRKLGALAG